MRSVAAVCRLRNVSCVRCHKIGMPKSRFTMKKYAGRVNSGHTSVSVARMQSPSGWQEPGQRPEFQLGEFWDSTDGIAHARGTYVFAVRAGRGARPVYVGGATRNFKQEVFTPHKLEKYQRCLADFKKGTPILYSSVLPPVAAR